MHARPTFLQPPRRSTQARLPALALLTATVACSGGAADPSDFGTGGEPSAGGSSSGGTFTSGGGTTASAGATTGGTGDGPHTGGSAATGGATASGGTRAGGNGAGGTLGSGGAVDPGGTLGSGGSVGSGDAAGSGSSTGSAGSNGSGGAAGTGGSMASGGTAGSGGGDGTDGAPPLDPDAVYAGPSGQANAAGTLNDPLSLQAALSMAHAGDTIYLLEGTYPFATTLSLNADGSANTPIELRDYPLDGGRPLLDFSQMAENSSNRGLALSGDYWHLYGIDVFHAGDNCLFVSGSHNVIEYSTFSECADTGLQLGNGAAENLIKNCDSFFNADSSLENADGFAAKLDVGSGNRFLGCRAWNNLDDGWDGYLRPADNIETSYENCWAIDNGKLKNGSVGAGDGNGFKTGGSDDKDLHHNATYVGCIAAGNVHDGFDHNSNRGKVTILNSAAHNNGSNINFSTSNIAASLTIKNTISLGTNGALSATATDIAGNSWQNGLAATAEDFLSLDISLLKGPRQSDGSLPDVDYLKLTPTSDLRNAGVDVGLPFAGSAPDVGPFESAD